MTRLGLQIPNFSYPGVPDEQIFDRVAGAACQAEQSGFDTVLVMDHFYQLPALGPPDNHMLESYTVLAALATQTSRVRLSTLVTGNTYRNPAHLAKIVTTLDLISGGRAMLGIGTGWFELEHQGYGFEFGTLRERFDRLEEALQIIRALFRGERPSFAGHYYTTQEAINAPAPLQADGPPILIGGNGEKRTLRLVAEYGAESNLTCPPEEIPRKLEVLARHCEDVGRDPAEVGTSWLGSLIIAPTTAQAEAARNDFLRQRGMEWSTLPDELKTVISKALIMGDPDTVGDFVSTKLVEAGLDGVIVNLPANGHQPEAVALVGETLDKVLP